MDPEASRYDVFISYSHEDARKYGEKAIQLIKDMIEADLHDSVCRPLVFLDSEALKFGDEWHAKIMDKLNECRVFICLLSENYLNSSYCTRERLWWEKKEIWQGRLRQDTLPVYFISLNNDPFKDTRRQVRDLSGFQMNAKPWFEDGANEVKKAYLEERIAELKKAVASRLSRAAAAAGFNTVFPEPSKSFVGRIVELRELREFCKNQHYPIIEGGAGVGKSELATVYAYGYADEYPQGRFLIHMEGKKNWEEAVVSLVKDLDTGIDVQEELEISDEDMKKGSKDLHRLIVRKLFARAKKGCLLLVLDNVDDASLFNDQRLLEFSIRTIPQNIHMIATTRHKLEFHNLHRAKAYPIENLDDDASFELFCEIGENRYPFCTRPILDRTSDPEYAAAMEIIHLLEGHVWSMEIIAGQIAVNYKNGVTFKMKLSMLKEQFSINDDGYLRRNVAENPEELLQATLDILKNCENGDVIVQLAYFAAMLAPDGKKTDVLRACWDKFFLDVQFKEKSENTFKYAYNHLWQYNLIHGENDDKMHRLTQAALKQIMKDDGIFDECVSKLADIATGTLQISNSIWIDAFSSTPELMECLNRKKPEFLTTFISHKSWIKLLLSNPSSVILAGLCPWDKLNGDCWAKLLTEQPQFADKCLWDKLNGDCWAELLTEQPQFADKCLWGKLDGNDWAALLRNQLQFADKCSWDTLDGNDWTILLMDQPQFSDKCPWGKLNGRDWTTLLQKHPQFADKCQWDKLNEKIVPARHRRQVAEGHRRWSWEVNNWTTLLISQPQFADKCSWNTLDGKDWADLLQSQPQFADKCPWEKLDKSDWAALLAGSAPSDRREDQPQFADKCPWEKLEGSDWQRLLSKRPQYADKCPWDKLDGGDWTDLLGNQLQFADKCSWDTLDGNDWTILLMDHPQFSDKCPWGKLNGRDWTTLLRSQPQFVDKCLWDKLDGKNWARLLRKHPQFADTCPWDKLTGKDWAWLLKGQPQFADKCPWDEMESYDWTRILMEQPQFIEVCHDKLSGGCWASLLSQAPQFADRCPWDKLRGINWDSLLRKQPQFADRIPWDKLNGFDWCVLIDNDLQFADKCQWDKLDGEAWALLLRAQPQFADKCPWDKLDEYDWVNLLGGIIIPFPVRIDSSKERVRRPRPLIPLDKGALQKTHVEWMQKSIWSRNQKAQPQFADKCQWEKLSKKSWAYLLSEQPQFADKCQLDELIAEDTLSGMAWAGLLIGLPQLADRCPWEKLDGKSWMRLLLHRPEFASRCPWDKLNEKDWTWLLEKQPQFADKWPWEKLRGFHWKKLLERQPQFARFRKG